MEAIKTKKPYYGLKNNGLANFSVKDVDTSSRTICAVLNTYNYLDSDEDVLMKGCSSRSIKARGVDSSASDKIVHALFHDLTRLPGKIKVLDERSIDGKDCLYMESKLTDTTDGNDTLKNYVAGIYNQHSIGFQYTKIEMIMRDAHGNSKQWDNLMSLLINPDDAEGKDYIYRVDEIKLFEGSTVAFGANSMTPCIGMKSENKEAVMLDYMNRIDLFEKTIRSGSQSDDMIYKIELQALQLKQALSEIFSQFQLKSAKTMAQMQCDNEDCNMYGQDVMANEGDMCEACGEELKCKKSENIPDFYSKIAKMIIS